MLSIVPIPLQIKTLELDAKLQQFREARVLNLSMTTSRDEAAK